MDCEALSVDLQVDEELEIKAYYAGHVLGAAMVHIKVGSESVVYTVRKEQKTQELVDSLTLVLNFNHVIVFFVVHLLGRLQHDARQAFRVSVVDEAPVESVPYDPRAVHPV